MSKENYKNVSNCKQSFKAVENFLRKVAFNLGNTESRTEVKIISCIPIDVTDLQQRIFQLQNELAVYKGKEHRPCPICTKRAESKRQVLCNELLLDSTNILSSSYTGGYSSAQLRPTESTEPRDSRDYNGCLSTSDKSAKTKFLFTKNKGHKKKVPSSLVYCAQTEINTPFSNKKSLPDDIAPMKPKTSNNETLNRLYLADVIKRQYDNRPLANECSGLSDISTPVCRDHVPFSPNSPYVESDVCSCFHGQFQNVDKYMNNQNCFNQYRTFNPVDFDNNLYYDSKFYDLVPVKEKIIKHKNVIDKHKRRESKNHSIIKCRPEHIRPKHRDTVPMVVNYCTTSPIRNKFTRLDKSSNDKHAVMDRMARFVASTPRRFRDDIDLGPVYAKQTRNHKKPNIISTSPQRHNVATGSSAKVNIAAAQQTAASAGTITDTPVDKTETTLDQIKTMLQTVLTEVKTKSYIGKLPAQSKKDAVVQNGPTRNFDYGASQLLQSYTYSPYNMSPFVPSCSPPMSCSNYVYPEYTGTQGIPFQQYPLLIQPQKHMCNNYYRNNNFTRPITKYATTAATNTEQAQERSKETEQLIKEIYKSMALNMDESSKDNSIREYTKTKTAGKQCVNTVKMESDRESRNIAQAISEIFRNSHLRDSTVTGTTDTTINSYLDPNKTKAVTEEPVKRNPKTERNYRQNEHYTKYKRDREIGRMATHHETVEQSEHSDDTVIENTEDSETSSETELDRVIEARKEPVKSIELKKEKSGLFMKMLKIFQPRRRRRRIEEKEGEKESESDSDDYQTVYSHKVVDATPKQKRVQIVRSRPHSKVFYSKQPQKRTSRTKSPEKYHRTASYIEREYKKYWDEKLMYHERQRQRYNPGSRPSPDRDQRKRHYYQNYEARPIFVEPIRQAPLRPPGNMMKPRYTVSRSNRHGEDNETQTKYSGYNYPIVRNNTNSGPTGVTGPHFVTVKNSTRKATFAKGWLKKCKPCAQQWKNLIING